MLAEDVVPDKLMSLELDTATEHEFETVAPKLESSNMHRGVTLTQGDQLIVGSAFRPGQNNQLSREQYEKMKEMNGPAVKGEQMEALRVNLFNTSMGVPSTSVKEDPTARPEQCVS